MNRRIGGSCVLALLTCFLLAPRSASSQSSALSSLLDVSTDTRSVAMGRAGAASASGPMAGYANPALMASHANVGLELLPRFRRPFEGFELEDYSIAFPLGRMIDRRPVVALSYRRSVQNLLFRTAFDPQGTVYRNEAWTTSLTTAAPILPWLSAGLAIRLVEPGSQVEKTVVYDFGLAARRELWSTPERGLRATLGLAARNLGRDPGEENLVLAPAEPFEVVGSFNDLPRQTAAGASLVYWDEYLQVQLSSEWVDPSYETAPDRIYQRYGAEIRMLRYVALRGGYIDDDRIQEYTYGFGLDIPVRGVLVAHLNYAREPQRFPNNFVLDEDDYEFWSFGLSYRYRSVGP